MNFQERLGQGGNFAQPSQIHLAQKLPFRPTFQQQGGFDQGQTLPIVPLPKSDNGLGVASSGGLFDRQERRKIGLATVALLTTAITGQTGWTLFHQISSR
jgi:hypothetical protein